jgi:6-phosphogluconolactonase/glucosamine-6-phosphate isomerase/deaminase
VTTSSLAPARHAALPDLVETAGGTGLFVVGVGASDGHVAFNPPQTRVASRPQVRLHVDAAALPDTEGSPA